MKVFKIFYGPLFYAYAAETQELAVTKFFDEIGNVYTSCDEIPESEWDEKIIKIWVGNGFEKKPFKVSIRESIVGTGPQQIFSNDFTTYS